MFCEAYDQSLKDFAAGGEVLSPALQQHLASCESCRAVFAEEQSLFAAIDSGLRATANPEVPATLIPRVRVALNNETVTQGRGFNFLAWGAAGAIVTAAVVLAALYLPLKHRTSTPAEPARSVSVATIQNSSAPSGVNPERSGGVSTLQHKEQVVLVTNHDLKTESPEVLVSREEGVGLARYEEFLRRKQTAVLMASAKSLDLRQGIEPLQIAEIEFIDLKIPALSKWESEDDTK